MHNGRHGNQAQHVRCGFRDGRSRAWLALIGLLSLSGVGCGGEPNQPPGPSGSGDAQTPPMGMAALNAWLSKADYKTWACETSPMNARPNGAHARNRVCSNQKTQQNSGGEYAVDAASVKELFGSSDQIIGYAVSRHIKAGKSADSWYWYEISNGSVFADGVGAGVCNGCHSAAGTDATHQGHDYVYLQVK